MKHFKILLVAAALAAVTTGAQAENVLFPSDAPSSYNRASIGYEATIFTGPESALWSFKDVKDSDGMTLNGFALQYNHGFKLIKKLPLYLDLGLRMSFGFYNNTDTYGSETYGEFEKCEWHLKTMSMSIPVNVGYRLGFGKGMSLMPYTGVHIKANLLAKGNHTDTLTFPGYEDEAEVYTDKYNFFSKKDIFDEDDDASDYVWSRGQFGWQIGATFYYKRLNATLEYGYDFNRLYKGCFTSNVLLSLGYCF